MIVFTNENSNINKLEVDLLSLFFIKFYKFIFNFILLTINHVYKICIFVKYDNFLIIIYKCQTSLNSVIVNQSKNSQNNRRPPSLSELTSH